MSLFPCLVVFRRFFVVVVELQARDGGVDFVHKVPLRLPGALFARLRASQQTPLEPGFGVDHVMIEVRARQKRGLRKCLESDTEVNYAVTICGV